MPTAVVQLVGLEKTVTNRVITSVVRSFLEQTNLDKDTRLKIKSSFDQFSTKGLGDLKEDNAIPQLKNMKIEYEETVDIASTDTMAIHQGEYRDFFTTDVPEVHIRPVYIDSNMDITIQFKSTSKDRIVTWKNTILTYIARNTAFTIEDLVYTYLLPNQIFNLLWRIYKLAKPHLPLYSDFYQWLGAHSDGRLLWGADLTGTFRDVFIKEVQSRVYVRWDIAILENQVKETEDGKYVTDFVLKLTYQKPISIVAKYPTLICNKLLPEKYILPLSVIRDTDRRQVDRDRFLSDLVLFENQILVDMSGKKYIRYPWWDEGTVPPYHKDFVPIASILVSITEDNLRDLLSLTDMDLLVLNSDIEYWLCNGGNERVTKSYEAPIYIKLLENDRYVEDSAIEVDTDLNIKATKDLSICKEYRIVIFTIKNPCFISVYYRQILERDFPGVVAVYRESGYIYRNRLGEGSLKDIPEFYHRLTFGCEGGGTNTGTPAGVYGGGSSYSGGGSSGGSGGGSYGGGSSGGSSGGYIPPDILQPNAINGMAAKTVQTLSIFSYRTND